MLDFARLLPAAVIAAALRSLTVLGFLATCTCARAQEGSCHSTVVPMCGEEDFGDYLARLCACLESKGTEALEGGGCRMSIGMVMGAMSYWESQCYPCPTFDCGLDHETACRNFAELLRTEPWKSLFTSAVKNEMLRRVDCPDRFPSEDPTDPWQPIIPSPLPGPGIDQHVPGPPRDPLVPVGARDNPFGVPGDRAPTVMGVDVGRGTYEPAVVDLSFPSAGFPWVVGRSYSSQQMQPSGSAYVHYDDNNYQGYNWLQVSQPRFAVTAETDPDAIQRVGLSLQNNVLLTFIETDTGTNRFRALADQAGAVVFEADSGGIDTYTYYDQNGMRMVFLGGDATPSTSRYQLWKIVDPAGNTAFVGVDGSKGSCASDGYTSEGFIKEAHDTSGRRYIYTYSSAAIGGVKRLTQVKAERDAGGSTWVEVGRVEYDHVSSDAAGKGLEGDLRMVSVVIPTSATASSAPVTVTRRTYYRYYTAAWSDTDGSRGYAHTLKYVLEPEGVRRFDHSGTSFTSATDGALDSYAANFFEYEQRTDATDVTRRITKTFSGGDCGCSGSGSSSTGASTFSYARNSDPSDFRISLGGPEYRSDWLTRTEVTQADGTKVFHYFDVQGLPLYQVTKVTTGGQDYLWATQMTRNLGYGDVDEVRTPAAISSFDLTNSTITPRASEGLVQSFVYTTVGGKGRFVIDTKVKQGTGTTDLSLVSSTEYTSATFEPGGQADIAIRRPFPAASWAYDEELTTTPRSSSIPSARKTATAYTFWSTDDTNVLCLTPKVITTELPKVATDQHGAGTSGPAVQSNTYLRKDGTTAFTQRPAYTTRTGPALSYTLYTSGLVTRQVNDPSSGQSSQIASIDLTDFGLTLPTEGLSIVTEYTYDPQGRLSKTTLFKGSTDHERDALMFYTRLGDGRIVTLSVPEFTSTPVYTGPVSYSVSLHNGRPSAGATLGLSGTDGTTTTGINSWISTTVADELTAVSSSVAALTGLSTTVYDNAGGKVKESRTYHLLPSSLPGTITTNYDRTLYDYDGMGRVIKTTDPTDTVSETVYDGMGRPIASRLGTTASGSVRTVSRTVYDGAALGAISGGGNSHLTKSQQIPFPLADGGSGAPVGTVDSDGDPFNDTRITEMLYDFRGRAKVVKNPVSPHSVTKYDNRNRAIAAATYKNAGNLTITTDPANYATDRLSLSTSAYDARGQMYSGEDFEINQGTGAKEPAGSGPYNVIRSLNWFNAEGQLIQTRGGSFEKHAYDRLGRRTHTWQLAKSDDGVGTSLDYTHVLTITSDKTTVAGDEVLVESQTGYDAVTGRVLVSATIERHHNDSIGSTGGAAGSLEDNDDQDPAKRLAFVAADLKGRIQITAMWYDSLLRPTITGVYGTNGGSNYTYSTTAPTASSDSVLVTKREHDKFGRAYKGFDAKGNQSLTEYDDAGRPVATLANADQSSGDDRTRTVYVYEDGLQKEMWVDANYNGVFDDTTDPKDQKTSYTYGVSTADSPGPSAINANNLLRKVTYPPQMDTAAPEVLTGHNALGQEIFNQDQAGNVIKTDYDTGGREAHRRATTIISGFDNRVKRMSTTYDLRGMVEKLSQYGHETVGSGSIVDEVKYEYDHAGMIDKVHQDADSAVGVSGVESWVVDLGYEYSGLAGTGGGRDAYRLSSLLYPNAASSIEYIYDGFSVHTPAGRVGRVELNNVPIASYRYNGADLLIEQRLPGVGQYASQLGLVSSLDNHQGTFHQYPYLDRFDRVTRSFWRMDTGDPASGYVNNTSYPYDPAYYDVKIETPGSGGGGPTSGYDHNSNILRVEDQRWIGTYGFSQAYTVDRLDRLVDVSVPGASNPREDFTLDRLGNFGRMDFDADSNGTLTNTADLQDCRTHTQSNEIKGRDFGCDSPSVPNRKPKYNAVGEWVDDDQTLSSTLGNTYTWDVFGRLVKITSKSTGTPVIAEFTYDARHHRTAWRHPQAGGGGDEPLAQWFYPVYDHRWRMISVERLMTEAEGGDPDQTAGYERYYYHNAGQDGEGGASYIDSVIRRDRDANLEDEESDRLEEVRLYAQNWRGDVVALVKPNGLVAERYRYSAYGRPFNIQAADFDASGIVTFQDSSDFGAAGGSSLETADHNFSGVYSSDDATAFLADYTDPYNVTSVTVGNGWDRLSRPDHGNRKGYAGYEALAEPLASSGTGDVPPGLWLARHRWIRSSTGSWLCRDPLGYVDGANSYQYVLDRPLVASDPSGLVAASTTGGGSCGSSCESPPGPSLGALSSAHGWWGVPYLSPPPPAPQLQVCCRPSNGSDPTTHCELKWQGCAPGETGYPVWTDPSPDRSLPDGTPCSKATPAQIAACVRIFPGNNHPNRNRGYGFDNNCQSNTRDKLAQCCLKSSWSPSFYACSPRGNCLKWRYVLRFIKNSTKFIPVLYVDRVCVTWQLPDWHDPSPPATPDPRLPKDPFPRRRPPQPPVPPGSNPS